MNVKDQVRSVVARAVGPRLTTLERQVAELEQAVTENRRLNERLSDVLDVMAELLVPSVDRDDERLAAALAKLDKVV